MKRILADVDDQFHKEVKIEATKRGLSITEFIIKLLKKALRKK